jgi:hypothetical protein
VECDTKLSVTMVHADLQNAPHAVSVSIGTINISIPFRTCFYFHHFYTTEMELEWPFQSKVIFTV